ncbi:hypothetical protein [Roseicyclus persicicus]|uniref:Uncharacterized protein n=1 Tax=Roseicyclus persicicus TaxID=2650661 RepID=A0A7X6H116_9RHOB|nr:hypothetical protein [Roseibacterium persicicum]NKX46038.1 hypothetical protein [Roseibacterium persicicum]
MRGLAGILLAAGLAAPAAGQSLLDRVQGLYYPDLPGTRWDCRTLGGDGGALGVVGAQVIGVETTCTLSEPFPIPGMDAVRFRATCAGEGTTWDGGYRIVMPTDRGLLQVVEGNAYEWLRCPG